MFDPFQQQGPWSTGPGPLGDLQHQIAGVLNNADQTRIYIPTGPGNPIITLPRPQVGYRQAVLPVTPGGLEAQSTGSRGWAAVVFLIVLAVLVAVAVTALTGG
jgi:hypothetical protein